MYCRQAGADILTVVAETPWKEVRIPWGQVSYAIPGLNGTLHISADPRSQLFRPLAWVRILDPILGLQGLIDDLFVRAELPQQYVQEICKKVMKGVHVEPDVKRRYEAEAKRRKTESARTTFSRLEKVHEPFECFLRRMDGSLNAGICEHGFPVVTPIGSDPLEAIDAFVPPAIPEELDDESEAEDENKDKPMPLHLLLPMGLSAA